MLKVNRNIFLDEPRMARNNSIEHHMRKVSKGEYSTSDSKKPMMIEVESGLGSARKDGGDDNRV